MGRDKSRKFFKQKYSGQKKIQKKKVTPVDNKNNNNDEYNNGDDTMNFNNSSHSFVNEIDFDDKMSLISEITINDDVDENEQINAFDELHEHFDELNEKDSETRILALNKINHALKCRIFDEYFRKNSCDKLHGLIYMLVQSLHRGNVDEQVKALETVALTALSLQAKVDYFLKQFNSIIIPFIEKPHSRLVQIKAIAVWTCLTWIYENKNVSLKTLHLLENIWNKRLSNDGLQRKINEKQSIENENENESDNENTNEIEAIEDLPTSTIVQQNNDEHSHNDIQDIQLSSFNIDVDNGKNNTQEIKTHDNEISNNNDTNNVPTSLLTKINNSIKNVIPDDILVSALQNWTWIISSIGNAEAISSLFEIYCDDLLDILNNNTNTDVRIAAGEALTLLIANRQMCKDKTYDQDYDSHYDDMIYDDIVKKFEELSKENDKQRKNVLRDQRRKYRDFVKSISNEWYPLINIRLLGSKFSLEGWNKWIQYHGVKNILQTGFQNHLLQNTMLQRTFDMDDVEIKPQRLSKREKKLKFHLLQEAEKQVNLQRNDNRVHKQAFIFEYQ